jgi:hypothetical protein
LFIDETTDASGRKVANVIGVSENDQTTSIHGVWIGNWMY